jgi:flagellar biogenesis protein FliO
MLAPLVLAVMLSVPAQTDGGPETVATSTDPAVIAEQQRLEKLREELEAVEQRDFGNVEEPDGRRSTPKSLGTQLVNTVIALGAVVLLAYLLLGKALPKLMRIEPPVANRKVMQVIDRLPLDQRRSILVVRIGEQYFLVGASEGGINLIAKLEADEVAAALATQEAEKPTLGRLATMLSRKPK